MVGHYPVMLQEVLDALALENKKLIVDGTFGGGGYTRAILESSNASVIAIDRDHEAIARSKPIADEFKTRFSITENTFSNIKDVVKQKNITSVDGVVFDIGVSSFQIDTPERGFSFMHNGELDMRMSKQGITARQILEEYSEEQLAMIFKEYGEERHSRLIARKIKEHIEEGNVFDTTLSLAKFIDRTIKGKKKIHPATRVFQALRIEVNQELEELKSAIDESLKLLNIGGRLVIVSFHSLEDRIVKERFLELAGKRKHINKYKQEEIVSQNGEPVYQSITSKVLVPSDDEIKENVRSRSAKMRIIERVA
jgi:16S rRNA (cytosine1402-N4)-methyltransferase